VVHWFKIHDLFNIGRYEIGCCLILSNIMVCIMYLNFNNHDGTLSWVLKSPYLEMGMQQRVAIRMKGTIEGFQVGFRLNKGKRGVNVIRHHDTHALLI
jgi:hypothetical protein